MESVGTARLKNNLSRYLAKVRKGASILVMDRDEPVAKLVPLDKSKSKKKSPEEILAEMAAEGLVTPPKNRKRKVVFKPLDLGMGNIMSRAVIEDREEGW